MRVNINEVIDYDLDGYFIEVNGEKKRFSWEESPKKPISKIVQNDIVIHGKDSTKNISSLVIEDDKIFIHKLDGTVEERPMVYWILAPYSLDKHYKKLNGSQHYCYIKTFENKKSWQSHKQRYRKANVDFYCVNSDQEQAMIYHGITLFKNTKFSDIPVLSFDIESAGLAQDESSKVFLITNTFYDGKGSTIKKHFRVDHYGSDVEMIDDWCNWVVSVDPVVITGHNIYGYDIPYIQYCYGKALPLGKYGDSIRFENYESVFRVDGNTEWNYKKIRIKGRHVIDGMFIAVKHDIGRNYPSWGLKQIAEYEGFVAPDRQFYDASLIGKNWSDPIEREKIVQYGIDDSDDSLAIYNLMAPSIFYTTQYVPKDYQTMGVSATGSQLNGIMVRAYLQENHSIPKTNERVPVGGGISFGIPGVHRNVFKIDVASLYPSIIRAFKVYPLEKDPKQYYFKMVDYFTKERFKNKKLHKETKNKYYDDLQASQKVFINSAYGLTSTNGLNFNDFDCANFITGMGRQIIKETIEWSTGKSLLFWWEDYKTEKDSLYDGKLKQYKTYQEFITKELK